MNTNNRTKAVSERLIGNSEVMGRLKSHICKVAKFPWPVLILGESGSGKELTARTIHDLSPKWNKPFIPVNCAGLPDTLVESEFFGYKRGAFTGAETERLGKFQEANGGTIFLDEIGEASPKFQVTLLRVLETGKITKVGDVREEPVDVRIICATNKPIDDLMGDMRADLFHRISTFPLCVPPLRQRRTDIPMLARHFIKQFKAEFSEYIGECEELNVSKIDAGALDLLIRLNFYGNVRELKNLLQRAIMLSESEETSVTKDQIRKAVNMIPHPGPDEAVEALKWLYEWAVSNQRMFWNRHRETNRVPAGGWAGRWDIRRIRRSNDLWDRTSPNEDQWKDICFTIDTVVKLLDEGEFDEKTVIQTWMDREWLSHGKHRATKTSRIDNTPVTVYCFTRRIVEKNCFLSRITD